MMNRTTIWLNEPTRCSIEPKAAYPKPKAVFQNRERRNGAELHRACRRTKTAALLDGIVLSSGDPELP